MIFATHFDPFSGDPWPGRTKSAGAAGSKSSLNSSAQSRSAGARDGETGERGTVRSRVSFSVNVSAPCVGPENHLPENQTCNYGKLLVRISRNRRVSALRQSNFPKLFES